jgi:hypothetical protein
MPEPCPYLPEADPAMTWQSLNSFKDSRDIRFYLAALKYAQVLWLKVLPARAVLALDRALLSDLSGHEPEMTNWPLPYRAMAWMIQNYVEKDFVGNPRIHFQHLATRVKGQRAEQRKWRAWACWYLARQVRSALPGDPLQGITEPSFADIKEGLQTHGIEKEWEVWESVVSERTPV